MCARNGNQMHEFNRHNKPRQFFADDEDHSTVGFEDISPSDTPSYPPKAHSLLLIVSRRNRGKVFGLNQAPVMIGREESCEVHLPYPEISRSHARIDQAETSDHRQQFTITDLKSRNGVYVNGTRIHEKKDLKHFDQIRVGSTDLQFIEGELQEVERAIKESTTSPRSSSEIEKDARHCPIKIVFPLAYKDQDKLTFTGTTSRITPDQLSMTTIEIPAQVSSSLIGCRLKARAELKVTVDQIIELEVRLNWIRFDTQSGGQDCSLGFDIVTKSMRLMRFLSNIDGNNGNDPETIDMFSLG